MLRVQEKHKESLESQEELLNEMEAVNRMTEREKKAEEEKRKMRERELHTQVNILLVDIYLQCTARNIQVTASLLQACYLVAIVDIGIFLHRFLELDDNRSAASCQQA